MIKIFDLIINMEEYQNRYDWRKNRRKVMDEKRNNFIKVISRYIFQN